MPYPQNLTPLSPFWPQLFFLYERNLQSLFKNSVADLDPCGSVLILHPGSGSVVIWISWIRIRICFEYMDPDQDLGELLLALKI